MNDTEFQPEVSVIVPNDNHAALFRERLESMLNQTYPYHEPIVLDDASSDTSVEVIHQSLSAVKHQFFLNKTNSGSTFLQWDRALAMAKGEPIWIAESDDIADPTLLEKPLQTFGDNDVALAY
jgi:glycosyltransferase involved in cell wall biosynthesis